MSTAIAQTAPSWFHLGELNPAEPRRNHVLRWVAVAVLLCNLIDLILTTLWLNAGLASESNPLMDVAVVWGAVPFAVAKMTLVSCSVLLLWMRRDRILAVVGLCAAFATYLWVMYIHLQGISMIAANWMGIAQG